MNLTKAEIKVALQAKLDADTAASSYTVATGVETICAVSDLLDSTEKALYYGTLTLRGSGATHAAEVKVIGSPKMAETPAWPKQVAAEEMVSVGKSVQLNDIAFSYLEGATAGGVFTGYKFALTTIYSLLEDGSPELDENQNPVVAP